jgi:hypothetical protein
MATGVSTEVERRWPDIGMLNTRETMRGDDLREETSHRKDRVTGQVGSLSIAAAEPGTKAPVFFFLPFFFSFSELAMGRAERKS